MASLLYAGDAEQQQQQQQQPSRGLSAIFTRCAERQAWRRQSPHASGLGAMVLSNLCKGCKCRKKTRAANGILEAEQEADALDAFHIAADSRGAIAAVAPLAGTHPTPALRRGGASSRGDAIGSNWHHHQRSETPTEEEDDMTAAAAAAAAAAEAELHQLRSQCARQAQQLAALQEQLSRSQAAQLEAQGMLNMQRLKFELLLDLWSMRVLDNEELGAHADPAAETAPAMHGRR